jgi:hypothetical protein
VSALIDELPFADFDRVFASYWGRRSLGLVVDDGFARQLAGDWRRLRELHRAWLTALREFPATSTGIRLTGTPALTPEVLDLVRADLDQHVAPPPALVGAFADPAAPASPGAVPTVPTNGAPSGFVMADAFCRGALARLKLHWPELPAGADGTGIRLRVSGKLWLHATPPALLNLHWAVRPLAERHGALVEIAHTYPYQLGVTANHSPEDVADRLYNELGWWWISSARLLQP